MKTERATKGRTTYLQAPLYLRIAIGQISEDWTDIGVELGTGKGPTMRGQVRVRYDATQSIAPLASVQLYEWLAWYLEAERRRRLEIQGQPPLPVHRHPDWPSPIDFPPMTPPLQGRRAED